MTKRIGCILIIDDDKMFTYILTRQLKIIDRSEQLLVHHHGAEAIEALQKIIQQGGQEPDIILLDLNMPVMDGWQFLDEFATLNLKKKAPVYILSSSIDPADHERAAQYQLVHGFYTKPINAKDLIKIIDAVEGL